LDQANGRPRETDDVRGTIQSGLFLAGVNLALVDAETFEDHYNHMHVVNDLRKPAN